eukprot:1838064-Rhodomonas_salina.1
MTIRYGATHTLCCYRLSTDDTVWCYLCALCCYRLSNDDTVWCYQGAAAASSQTRQLSWSTAQVTTRLHCLMIITDKKPQGQYSLCQECGFLYLIMQRAVCSQRPPYCHSVC